MPDSSVSGQIHSLERLSNLFVHFSNDLNAVVGKLLAPVYSQVGWNGFCWESVCRAGFADKFLSIIQVKPKLRISICILSQAVNLFIAEKFLQI